MGVPGLRKYIRKTFPKALGNMSNLKNLFVHNLYFDVTSIIVNSLKSFYPTSDEIHPEIQRETARQIDRIVQAVKPSELIYISYDGEESFSKSTQTRQRGYQRLERRNLDGRHETSLSQLRTLEYVKKYIQTRIEEDPIWNRCKVVINSPLITGEAEHKIAEHIRYMREQSMEPKRTVIYSVDGDMIFLALQAHEPDMFIIRKSTLNFDAHFDSPIISDSDLETISIGSLRDSIGQMLGSTSPEDKERLIDDFVGFACLVGNDFIPPFPDAKEVSLGSITQLYLRRSERGYLVEDGRYNRRVLRSLLEALARSTLRDGMTLEEKREAEMEKMRANKNISKPIDVLISGVLDGLDWLLLTYTTGVPSWRWIYPDIFAPPLCCVLDHVEDHVSSFEHDEPFSMLFGLFRGVKRTQFQIGPLYEAAHSDPRVMKFFPPIGSVEKLCDGTFVPPVIDFDEILAVYNENLHLVTEEPHLTFSKPGKPIVVRKDSVEDYIYKSNGPTKPMIPPPVSDVTPAAAADRRKAEESPCALFYDDFEMHMKDWIDFRGMRRFVKTDYERLKMILSHIIVEDDKFGTNIGLQLTAFQKKTSTPGYALMMDNETYFSREALELIRRANETYPKYIKGKMKHSDFEGDDEVKAMTFFTKTMCEIPFAAPASVRSLPISAIREIESGKMKAMCRVEVARPCVLPAGARGVVIADDSVNKRAYLLMDKEYGSTSTLHFLLKSPRGIVLDYDDIQSC